MVWDCSPDEGFDDCCCPKCGWDSDGADYHLYMIACTEPEPHVGISMGNGPWNAAGWVEIWKCSECGILFEVECTNY